MKQARKFFFLFAVGLAFASQAQDVEVIKFDRLDQIIKQREGGVKVINFWATWCKPCIEELGYFEEVNDQYKTKGVEVILVSFDFVEDLDTKVKRFVDKRNINSRVLLLDETDYNAFIDKVSPSWSGAIPATLIIDARTGKKEFYEKTFKEGELKAVLNNFVN